MAQLDADRVLETSNTAGAGSITLLGSVAGYRSMLQAGAIDGTTVDLYLEDVFPSTGVPTGAYEYGTYTWRTGGILERTTIRGSSNGGAPVSWGVGVRRIGMGMLAYMVAKVRQGSTAIQFMFDGATADADPGAGALRANAATLGAATMLYVSTTDADQNDIGAALDAMGLSTSPGTRATLQVREGATGRLGLFRVIGAPVDGGTYRKVPVVCIAGGASSFSAGNQVGMSFAIAGDMTAAVGQNQQVQFNDGGAIGASPLFTFDKATGNLTLGGALAIAGAATFSGAVTFAGGASAAGADKQVQFNDGGLAAGNAGLSFDKAAGKLTVGGLVAAATLAVSSGALVASTPSVDATQTWNNAAVAFTGLRLNVTDTASAAGSLLADLQVGGVSKFNVRKDGALTLGGNIVFGAADSAHGMLRPNGNGVDVVSGDGTLWTQLRAGNFTASGAATVTGTLTAQNSNFFVGNGLGLRGMGIWWDNGSGVYDAAWFRESAGAIGQRVASGLSVAQTQRWYENYTDASNYSRAFVRTTNSSYEFGGESAGTATARSVVINSPAGGFYINTNPATTIWRFSTSLLSTQTDRQADLGSPSIRFGNGYFSGTLQATSLTAGSADLAVNGNTSIFLQIGGATRWFLASDFNLKPISDNTQDIGDATTPRRIRTGYFGTSVNVGNASLRNGNGGGWLDVGTTAAQGALRLWTAYTSEAVNDGIWLYPNSNTWYLTTVHNGGQSTQPLALIANEVMFGAGGGVTWKVAANTNSFVPVANISYDIGTTALQVRTVYAQSFAGQQLAVSATGSVWGYLSAASDLSNTIELQNGTNPNTLRVYGTRTDAANYERLALKYVGTGVTPGFLLTTENAGTGVARDLVLSGGTGVTHAAGDFHVGRGSSNSSLYLRTLALNAGSGSGALSFLTADSVAGPSISFYTAGNAATTMGAALAGGLSLFASGNIGIFANGKDINLGGGSSTAPSWSVKAAGQFLPGAPGVYDIGSTTNPTGRLFAAGVQTFYGGFTDSANNYGLSIGWLGGGLQFNTFFNGAGNGGGQPTAQYNALSHVFGVGTAGKWQIDGLGVRPYGVAGNDNTMDLGSSTYRVRTGYFGTAVAVNTTPSYSFHALGGGMRAQALATPAAPTVTNVGAAGTSTYTYYVVAKDRWGNKTLVSAAGTTATGNAALSATNYNTITWAAVAGAANYDVLKADTGHSIAVGITTTTFNDVGAASAVYTAPTRNATADLTVDGSAIIDGALIRSTGFGFGSSFGIGPGVNITGTGALAVGTNSVATYSGTAIGYSADTSAVQTGTAVGSSAKVTAGTGGSAWGYNAVSSATGAIALGRDALADLANTLCVGGGGSFGITDAYFGSGRLSATPSSFTLHASGGTGTDIAGANLTIAGGMPTGAGAGGSIYFATAPAGATGTALRSLVNRAQLDQSGNLSLLAGTSAFYAYNQNTDASNYTRLAQFWSGGIAIIQTQQAGTGPGTSMQIGTTGAGTTLSFHTANVNRWQIDASGNWLALAPNAYNIGSAAAPVAALWSAGTVTHYISYTDSANNYGLSIEGSSGTVRLRGFGSGTGSQPVIALDAGDHVEMRVAGVSKAGFYGSYCLPTSNDSYDLGVAGQAFRYGVFSRAVVTVPHTVATLPAAATAGAGARTAVTDSTVAAAGNYGAVVAGGGANVVPVFSTGTAWIIA